jgi:hypothetical protein
LALCALLLGCGDDNGTPDMTVVPPDMTVVLDLTPPADMAKPSHMCNGATDTSTTCRNCIQGVLGQGAQGSGPCKTEMGKCLADTSSGSDFPAPDGGMLSCRGVIDCLLPGGGGSQTACLGMASSAAQGLLFSALQCGTNACQAM